jgi:hypothetical protein
MTCVSCCLFIYYASPKGIPWLQAAVVTTSKSAKLFLLNIEGFGAVSLRSGMFLLIWRLRSLILGLHYRYSTYLLALLFHFLVRECSFQRLAFQKNGRCSNIARCGASCRINWPLYEKSRPLAARSHHEMNFAAPCFQSFVTPRGVLVSGFSNFQFTCKIADWLDIQDSLP